MTTMAIDCTMSNHTFGHPSSGLILSDYGQSYSPTTNYTDIDSLLLLLIRHNSG